MSYLVFARKYRPQKFDEVAGQQAIATTLKNAIESDRVAHAYLFCGPRGVGKTSMARIFSKALNCEQAIGTDPCNECDLCQRISTGDDIDVMELDGASNRGIDEIRQIRDNVRYASNRAKFKIYIIDEVHMLTKEAFNALLKTLEEPPPHVKFIFATTEVHRIPETILSRCQRFDFKRITVDAIIDRLQQICDAEGVATSREVLHGVAKAARGAMRDSQSLLDKLISFGHTELTKESLREIQGAQSFDEISRFVDLLVGKQAGEALLALDRILEQGGDLGEFVNQLIEQLRMMMLLLVGGGESPLLDVTIEELEILKRQAKPLSVDSLMYMIRLLSEAQTQMRFSGNTRIPIELAIVKLAQMEDLRPIGDVLKRLAQLEQSLKSVPHQSVAAPSAPRAIEPPRELPPPTPRELPPPPPREPEARPSPPPVPRPSPSRPAAESSSRYESRPAAESPAVAIAEPPPPEAEPATQRVAAQQAVNWPDVWPRVVEHVQEQDEMLASYLRSAHLLGDLDGQLKLGFLPRDAFKLRRLDSADKRKVIDTCLEKISGQRLRSVPVGMKEGDDAELLTPVLGTVSTEEDENKPAATEQTAFNPGDFDQHPTLNKVKDYFDAKVLNIYEVEEDHEGA